MTEQEQKHIDKVLSEHYDRIADRFEDHKQYTSSKFTEYHAKYMMDIEPIIKRQDKIESDVNEIKKDTMPVTWVLKHIVLLLAIMVLLWFALDLVSNFIDLPGTIEKRFDIELNN